MARADAWTTGCQRSLGPALSGSPGRLIQPPVGESVHRPGRQAPGRGPRPTAPLPPRPTPRPRSGSPQRPRSGATPIPRTPRPPQSAAPRPRAIRDGPSPPLRRSRRAAGRRGSVVTGDRCIVGDVEEGPSEVYRDAQRPVEYPQQQPTSTDGGRRINTPPPAPGQDRYPRPTADRGVRARWPSGQEKSR